MACYFAQRTIHWIISNVSNFLKHSTAYITTLVTYLSSTSLVNTKKKKSKIILRPKIQGEKRGKLGNQMDPRNR